ncbi:MAG: LPS export ABC transporter periplasmic protein LptC [Gammaproteobacteria bacterium]
MRPLVRHPWQLALLTSAALLTGYLMVRDRPVSSPEPAGASLGPGYYVKQARLTGTGEDGLILYRISATEAAQPMADGLITMQNVAVDYEPATEVPWTLHADRGQMPADRNIIALEGNVVATTTADASPGTRQKVAASTSTAPLVIRTDYLELDPDAYIARTERTVVVERGRDTLRARGMRAYLKQDRLQFNADVQARFLP